MQSQAELNRHQVVVDQIIAQARALGEEWEMLSRKAKLKAWAEWISAAPSQQVFSRYHRVLTVIEAVR